MRFNFICVEIFRQSAPTLWKSSERSRMTGAGPIYKCRVIGNLVCCLVFMACGVFLMSLDYVTQDLKVDIGNTNTPLIGGILVAVGLLPLATALLWVNLHKEYHRVTARQARYYLLVKHSSSIV